MMKQKILSHAEWNRLMLEMPLAPESKSTAEAAEKTVGCCVRTYVTCSDSFPTDFGRVLKYSFEHVVILCFADRKFLHAEKALCLWEGTAEDYHSMWQAD